MEFDFAASKLNNVYTTLEQDSKPFLVYTTCTQSVCKLVCTDTKTFWCKDINIIGINGEIKTAKFESEEKYIAYLRVAQKSCPRFAAIHNPSMHAMDMTSGPPYSYITTVDWIEVATASHQNNIRLEIICDNLLTSDFSLETNKDDKEVSSLLIGNSPVLRLEVHKWLDVNMDIELRTLLFRMAKHTSKITKELRRVEQGKGRTEYQSGMVMQDFSAKLQRGNAAPKIQRKPGMSVINPNSKKLKSDKGIVFD